MGEAGVTDALAAGSTTLWVTPGLVWPELLHRQRRLTSGLFPLGEQARAAVCVAGLALLPAPTQGYKTVSMTEGAAERWDPPSCQGLSKVENSSCQ